jgi:hypothetical protein
MKSFDRSAGDTTMNPTDGAPESPKHHDSPVAPPTPETNGQNGVSDGQSGDCQFGGPQPRKLTPEEFEWLRRQWDEEDEEVAAAGLREILDGRGVSSEELLREIEKLVRDDG